MHFRPSQGKGMKGVLVYATSVRGGRNQFEHLTIIHEVAVYRDPGVYISSRAGRLHQLLSLCTFEKLSPNNL
jgi:hypothetical protein